MTKELKTRKDWEEHYTKKAREIFADHVANVQDLGEIQVIDWKNKNGSNDYSVRYLLDQTRDELHISGDLGQAIFRLTWTPKISDLSGYEKKADYIMEKVACATDQYCYPKEIVRSEVMEFYKDCFPKREEINDDAYFDADHVYEDMRKEKLDALEEYIDCFNEDIGLDPREEVYANCLMETIEDAFVQPKWFDHDFGKVPSPRVYFWLVGLTMIVEQQRQEFLNSVFCWIIPKETAVKRELVYRDFFGFAVIYEYCESQTGDYKAVQSIDLKKHQISPEELDQAARKKTNRNFWGLSFETFDLSPMTGLIIDSGMDILLIPDALKEIGKMIGDDYFIAPASEDEAAMIVIKDHYCFKSKDDYCFDATKDEMFYLVAEDLRMGIFG